MGGFLDIIIFAAIAVALLWRLRSVLGERNQDDPTPFNKTPLTEAQNAAKIGAQVDASIKELPDRVLAQSPVNWAGNMPNYDVVETATAHHQLVPFVGVDPQFRPDDFIAKANKAFTMIVAAFAKGDKKTLEFLLAPNLYQAFAAQIDERYEKNETYTLYLNDIKRSTITRAELDGTTGIVTVDFVAEQSITHKSADGTIIAGEDGQRETTKDRWIFSKDLKSSDPKWLLIQTEEMD